MGYGRDTVEGWGTGGEVGRGTVDMMVQGIR